MPAETPTILATSGGNREGRHTNIEFAGLVHHAVELSGVHGRRPRVMTVSTAMGDAEHVMYRRLEAGRVAGFDTTPLQLFPAPNLPDLDAAVHEQDVVWVSGGSVANLLAVWRVHGLDQVFRRAWRAGVVLAGVSAGSLCWFQGGATDSFGKDLRPITDGLGLLPYGNGVHYDNEAERRPLMHRLVAEGVFDEAHCTDDGVGLVYRDTVLTEAVSELDDKSAWIVRRDGDRAVEEQLTPRRLD